MNHTVDVFGPRRPTARYAINMAAVKKSYSREFPAQQRILAVQFVLFQLCNGVSVMFPLYNCVIIV